MKGYLRELNDDELDFVVGGELPIPPFTPPRIPPSPKEPPDSGTYWPGGVIGGPL